MIIFDTFTAHMPMCFRFNLDEVQLILSLLYMKKQYSTDNELKIVELLIDNFEKMKTELEEDERKKAGL